MRHCFPRLLLTLPAIAALTAAGCGDSPHGPSPLSPRIVAITPAEGSTFGGTTVTISGSNFSAPVTVTIGGTPPTQVTIVDAATIQAVTPAHAAGSSDVSVNVLSTGSTVLKNGFRFVTPTVGNSPPTLTAIRIQSLRPRQPSRYANVDEVLSVTADVSDAETAASGLHYVWSASRGSVNGEGATVSYRAPHDAGAASIRLEVVERYDSPGPTGLPISQEHRVAGDLQIAVHDEVQEVGDMAKSFLERFSQSSVAPAVVVRDFQAGCGAMGIGKEAEESQTATNRRTFEILPDWLVGEPRVVVSFDGSSPFRARLADAWAALDVRWNSRCLVANEQDCLAVGDVRHDTGVDWVTARYDAPSNRWWLCDSDYDPRSLTRNLDFRPLLARPYLR